jgi:Xaa-Pro aminopeptidase
MKKLNVPLSEFKERIEKCQEKAKKAGLDALLVWSHSPDRTGNVKYLSNYAASILYNPSSLLSQPPRRGTSDTCVLVPVEGEPILIKMATPVYPDHMFPPLVEIAVKKVKEFDRDITDAVAEAVRENHLENKRIGVAGEDAISTFLMRLIKEKLPKVKFDYADEILAEMRITMSKNEVELVKKTGEMADKTMKKAVEAVKPGVSQRDIQSLIASTLTNEGAEKILFIDCSPGLPTEYWKVPNKTIQDDEIVQIDFGFEDENGYFADVSRTIVAGKASEKKREIVRLGRETVDYVASIAVPGIKGQEWLKKTRQFVEKRIKSGDYHIPAPWPVMYLGNALGLDMQPMFFDSEANMEVKEGMFLSIEIWLYVPGLGASRFEELVLVTKKGGEFLTKYRPSI